MAVGGISLGWGVAVELFQLTGIPATIAGVLPPAVLVLGTVFDARDLLVAVLVPVLAFLADTALRRIRRPAVVS